MVVKRIIIVIVLAIAWVIVYKYFKVILVSGLIFGALFCSLFSRNRTIGRNEAFRILAVNGFVLAFFLALLNTVYLLLEKNRTGESPGREVIVRGFGSYYLGGNHTESGKGIGLGYQYKENQEVTSSLVKQEKLSTKIIYDVKYSIDERRTRVIRDNQRINGSTELLLMGGSFMFGEGLKDEETFQYWIGRYGPYNTTNVALHGYGAHQVFKILEDESIWKSRVVNKNPDYIVYRFIGDHVRRASGGSIWDYYGPCYKPGPGRDELIKMGSFNDCKGIVDYILNRLKNSSEPLSRKISFAIAKHFTTNEVGYSEKELDLFARLIINIDRLARERNSKLLLIFDDLIYGNGKCKIDPNAEAIVNRISRQVRLIRASHALPGCTDDTANDYFIEFDGHPSSMYSRNLATYIARILNESPVH